MNDERLNQFAEAVGSTIQRVVESSTQSIDNKLDPTVSHRLLKFVLKISSKFTGVRLIVNSIKLNLKRQYAIAIVCYWIGTIILSTNLMIISNIDKRVTCTDR